MSPSTNLLRFHLKAGSRLAMRTGVPAAALCAVAIGSSPDPGAALRMVAEDLAGVSGSFAVGLLLAIIAGGMASWAVPRICHGVTGWVRHLPADWSAHRRALLGALTAAQLPVAIAWTALWLTAWSLGSDVDPRRLLAIPVVLVSVSLACMPSRRSILLSFAAVVTVALALFGGWPGLALAASVPFAAERLVVPCHGRKTTGVLWRSSVAAGLIPALIAFRAVGRRVLFAYAPVILPIGAAWLFVRNNPGTPHEGPLRLAAGCAVALAIAGLAEELVTRRPPWRWARSLPWSAADRVRDDVVWLAALALPILLLFGVLLSARQALLTSLILPLISIRAAGALRTPHRNANTFVRVFGEGLLVAAWLGVTNWATLPALILAWPAWREAKRRDRNLDVSRWSPQAHLASGDPVSWRGT